MSDSIVSLDIQTIVEFCGIVGTLVLAVGGAYVSLVKQIVRLQVSMTRIEKDINNLARLFRNRSVTKE